MRTSGSNIVKSFNVDMTQHCSRREPSIAMARQKGVGLIEVLISVLILAVGLMGIAAMQATALRNSQSSLERSQAVIHSYSILDAMRANNTAARSGEYNTTTLICSAGAVAAASPLVASDSADWISSLQASLGPDACGQIACAVVAGSTARDCSVTVEWNDSRGTDGASAQRLITETRI